MSAQQRDVIKDLSPPWLSSGEAEKLMYNFGLAGDTLIEKLNQAMRAHMPGAGTSTALVYIGNDRVIPRGPYESDQDYAGRLQRAFEAWQRAGSRRAVLSQVLAYLKTADAPANAPLAAIVGGVVPTWDVYYSQAGVQDVTGPPAHIVTAAHRFNWDGDFSKWWRAWLVIYVHSVDTGRSGATASFASSAGFASVTGLSGMTAADVGNVLAITGAATAAHNGAWRIEQYVSASQVIVSCGLNVGPDANNGAIAWNVRKFEGLAPGPAWGAPGATWGDMSRSWGLANPPGVMSGVLSILREWQSAHSFYPETVICFSGANGVAGADFSPYSTPGAGNPDGTWAHFSKIVGGVSVPARVFTGNYDAGYAHFNCFAGGSDP